MIGQLGSVPLFLGTETIKWSLTDFEMAAHDAKTLGCTSLLVKIADGANLWYGALGGWQKVIDAIKKTGIQAVPYIYCCGNKFGAIRAEIDILIAAMEHCGIVVADMEAEFNGQPGWADDVCNALKPIRGLFGVTTWADPQLQNWHGVLTILKSRTDFLLPQVYNDYLSSVYQAQIGLHGIPYYPILDLNNDAGPNNIIQIAKASKSPIIGLWEYQAAIGQQANIVKQISIIQGGNEEDMPKTIDLSNPEVAHHFEQSGAMWRCKSTGCIIGNAMLTTYKTYGNAADCGLTFLGLPTSNEYAYKLSNGEEVTVQDFELGSLAYDPKKLLGGRPGWGNGPVYPVHVAMLYAKKAA